MSEMPLPKLHQIDETFRNTYVTNLTPDQRDLFIAAFCNEDIRSDEAQIRSLIRTLAISHVQMSEIVRTFESTIKRLDADNGVVADSVHKLTRIAAWLGGAQLTAALVGVGFLVHGCVTAPSNPPPPTSSPDRNSTYKAESDGHPPKPAKPTLPHPTPAAS